MKKKIFNKGLVVGKFYPLHLGHCYLIDSALKQVDQLTIILCQTRKYKIPAKVRRSWLKELYPGVKVVMLNHKVYLDSESTDVSKEWADLTLKVLGYKPDVVFSSEDYGEVYAKYMGSKHVMVDKKRKKYSVSGTEIRKNPQKYWKYLPKPVKAYFAKRVVVLGAESTGTTTLAKDLAKYYKTNWVPEYGRSYYEAKMFSGTADEWNSNEFYHIAGKQNEIEEQLAGTCYKVLICDTDSFATTIWHLRYLGYKQKRLEMLVNTDKHDLYIVTGTDIPFVQDGTRDGENIRQWMHDIFIEELKKRKLEFILVEGDREHRLKKATAEVDKYLN